jgi:ATP-dependent DNA helicase RecQ
MSFRMPTLALPATDHLHACLQRHFGLRNFRPGQEDALRQVLAGRDTLAVMPTGGGKSLIYQLGAMMLPGTTLVVSPLIALMKDQAERMIGRGLPVAYFESGADIGGEQLRRLAAGRYKLVLAAPERLQLPAFRAAMAANRCGLFAVDEAHCVSQWGHDFRPDYRHLADVRRELRPHAALGLTATATPQARDDIIRLLGLREPALVVTGFDRPNLFYEVHSLDCAAEKQSRLAAFLAKGPGAGIVYVGKRKDAEEIAANLSCALQRAVHFYHAGMPREQRAVVQDRFMTERDACVVATNAFGMGIDRADLLWVIHYQMPGTLEAYYQEAGRAGRDGEKARAILLYAARDRRLHDFFISTDAPTPEQLALLYAWLRGRVYGRRENMLALRQAGQEATRLPEQPVRVGLDQLQTAGVLIRVDGTAGDGPRWQVSDLTDAARRCIAEQNDTRRAHKRRQLDRMIEYAEGTACRRRAILDYFGDEWPGESARCCDCCQPPPARLPPPGATRRRERRRRASATVRVVTLGDSGDLAHVGELIRSLSDPDGNVRRLAASALGKLRAADAVGPLLELLRGETGPQVRQYSIIALGRIGDPRAIPALQKNGDDGAEKSYNRAAAWDAIALIRARQ